MDDDFSDDNGAPLPIKTNNIQSEICSFSEANVDENNVAEVEEDIDEDSAPLPDYLNKNNNEEAALSPNALLLKDVLEKSRKKLSEIQQKLVEKLHDDAKILRVNDDNGNSASVYLQFDEKKYGDNVKIKNAINQAIEYAKDNKQNFEIKTEYLPYIKSIFVDRKSVEKYSQGGGDDEVLLNGGFNNRKLTRLKFYQKHTKHPGKGELNMIMVAEYKIGNKMQYCIIDMDNNLMISNDQLNLYWHNMDDFENYGFDDEEHKVYETGLKWCAFRINNRLHNDGFTEAKKFILTNGSKLYGIKTLEGVTKHDIYREYCYIMEGRFEHNNECLTWAKELIKKISAISNSINSATTIQQLYETFLQDIQKDLLKVNCKLTKEDNNFLYVNGKDIVDFFSKNSAVNKTIKRSDFDNNISTSEFKQEILGEIFQNNTGDMTEIEFVKAFLEKATQHIVETIDKKIEKLNKNVPSEQTNNGETTRQRCNTQTKLEEKEGNDINNDIAKCGCCKGFSLCDW